jgi:type IV secretory pathway VirB10-like protein
MSAPRTNLEKQRRRHWGPLTGIVAMLVLVSVLITVYMVYLADTETPEQAPVTTQAPAIAPLPAEGAPSTPMSPSPGPQVVEQPAPPAPVAPVAPAPVAPAPAD